MMLAGCGDKETQETKEVAVQTVENTKEAMSDAGKEAKEMVKEVKEEAKEMVKEVKEEAKEMVKEVKEEVKEVTSAPAATVDGALYTKCVACHGVDGKTKALGKSAILAGQSQEEIATKLKGYKAGALNVAGMGMLMQGQVKSMSDADIEAVATYIATFK
jgi:cytochrome c553